jgi:hypothetical protein
LSGPARHAVLRTEPHTASPASARLGRAPLAGRHARGREYEQAKHREEVRHWPWAWQPPERRCKHTPEPSRWPDMEGDLNLNVARKAGDGFPAVVAQPLADYSNNLVIAGEQHRRPALPLMRRSTRKSSSPHNWARSAAVARDCSSATAPTVQLTASEVHNTANLAGTCPFVTIVNSAQPGHRAALTRCRDWTALLRKLTG